jgi:hypothetical protein
MTTGILAELGHRRWETADGYGQRRDDDDDGNGNGDDDDDDDDDDPRRAWVERSCREG